VDFKDVRDNFLKEINLLTLSGIELKLPGRPGRSQVTLRNRLCWTDDTELHFGKEKKEINKTEDIRTKHQGNCVMPTVNSGFGCARRALQTARHPYPKQAEVYTWLRHNLGPVLAYVNKAGPPLNEL
jgi:hypothetical protein